MSDILDRLQNRIHDSHMDAERLMDDAYDEIERLRSILRRCMGGVHIFDLGNGECRALYQEPEAQP